MRVRVTVTLTTTKQEFTVLYMFSIANHKISCEYIFESIIVNQNCLSK